MRWEILGKETLYEGFFRLERVHLKHARFAGGEITVAREHLERGDAVGVVLHDPRADEVLLIEQFRVGPAVRGEHPWLVEIVAGVIDPGETPEACARRECLEEAGYAPEKLVPLGTVYATPGGSSERFFFFLAQVDKRSRRHEGGGVDHEGEDIRSFWVPKAEAIAWVYSGRIRSALPALGLLLAFGGHPSR
ncbi:MAG: NUDIX domain-containing protein [Zetaproteobacteria bacterium]|nr:MAG: NUDIX domain-containing protein [Zetaproteobacteria bacterium]